MTEPSLSSTIHPNEINMLDYARIIWQRRKLIFYNLLIITFLVFLISLIMPKTFRASAVLMPPESEQDIEILNALMEAPLSSFLTTTDNATMSIVAILKSRTVMENVINEFDLISHYRMKNIEEAIEKLTENTQFEIENEGTIRISAYTSTNWFHSDVKEEEAKHLSANIANYFVSQLDIVNQRLQSQHASFQRIFIEERYKQNIVDLENAENKLKNFQEKHSMVELHAQTIAAIETAAALKGKVLVNEVQLGVISTLLIPDHPDIKRLKKEIEELNIKLRDMDYGSDMNSMDRNKVFPIFSEVPELGVNLVRLEREVEIQNTLFTFLMQQYEEAKIKEARDTPTVQVLDNAKIPIRHYSPRRVLIVVSSFLFLLFINMIYVVVKINYYNLKT